MDSWPSSPNLNLYRSTGVANQAYQHITLVWVGLSSRISSPQKLATPTQKKKSNSKSLHYYTRSLGSFLCFLGLVFFFRTTLSPAAFAPMEAHAADGEDPGQGQNAAAHGGGAQVNDLGASPSIAMLVIKHGITYNHDVDLGHIYIYTPIVNHYINPLYIYYVYIMVNLCLISG